MSSETSCLWLSRGRANSVFLKRISILPRDVVDSSVALKARSHQCSSIAVSLDDCRQRFARGGAHVRACTYKLLTSSRSRSALDQLRAADFAADIDIL
jgi:hypothetical protein